MTARFVSYSADRSFSRGSDPNRDFKQKENHTDLGRKIQTRFSTADSWGRFYDPSRGGTIQIG